MLWIASRPQARARRQLVRMNLIVLQPGQRGRIHAHDTQEEVYLVLEGVLTLLIEGESAFSRRTSSVGWRRTSGASS